MPVPATVLVPQLISLGNSVLQVVQEVRRNAVAANPDAAVAPSAALADDVLGDHSIQAQRLLTGELSARNDLVLRLERVQRQEADATRTAAILARSAPSAEAAQQDPAALEHMMRAQSLRREAEQLHADLVQAEAQVTVVRDFMVSLERTREDVNRSIAALRRGHERAQRLAELSALSDGVSDRMARVDRLTAELDTARAQIEAGWEARTLQPGMPTFLAQGRVRTAEAADELSRLRDQR